MKKSKFYAVKRGRKRGIYESWDECKEQTDGYPNVSYKGFETREEAESWLGAEEVPEHSPDLERCTEEQRAAIEAALRGDSMFITGPGGTGKSFLLSVLYDEFRLQGKRVAVTAMTGCAALLLGSHAKTLHSWAGIGLGKGPADTHIRAIVMNGRKKKNWNQTDCLVIDEVSMLTPQLLELLDQIARTVRKRRGQLMGGLQVIFVGDFYQLPPVSSTQFAFQSEVWKQLVKDVYQLTIIHRQRDPVFQKILNEARIGELTPESVAILTERKTMLWRRVSAHHHTSTARPSVSEDSE
jgi:hypothetical protein